jgi:hypothetical protein
MSRNRVGLAFAAAEARYRVECRQNRHYRVHIREGFVLTFLKRQNGYYSCFFSDEIVARLRAVEANPSGDVGAGGGDGSEGEQDGYNAVDTTAAEDRDHSMSATSESPASATSVEELERQYSKREVERARTARGLADKLFHPPTGVLVKFVNCGALNMSITGRDVMLHDSLYGRAEYLKGRAKFSAPQVPRELRTCSSDWTPSCPRGRTWMDCGWTTNATSESRGANTVR